MTSVLPDHPSQNYRLTILEEQLGLQAVGVPEVLGDLGPVGQHDSLSRWRYGGQTGQGAARTVSIVAETKTRVGLLDTALLTKEYESISPRLKSLISSLIQRLIITTQKAVRLATE